MAHAINLALLLRWNRWLRILHPPIHGRLERGFEGVDVGQKLRVQLVRADVERGYIDFARVA